MLITFFLAKDKLQYWICKLYKLNGYNWTDLYKISKQIKHSKVYKIVINLAKPLIRYLLISHIFLHSITTFNKRFSKCDVMLEWSATANETYLRHHHNTVNKTKQCSRHLYYFINFHKITDTAPILQLFSSHQNLKIPSDYTRIDRKQRKTCGLDRSQLPHVISTT